MQNNQNNTKQPPKKKYDFLFFIFVIVLIIGIIVFFQRMSRTSSTTTLSYEEFNAYRMEADEEKTRITGTVKAEVVGDDNDGLFYLRGSLSNGDKKKFKVIVTSDVLAELQTDSTDNIEVKIYKVSENIWLTIFISFLPYIIFIAILFIGYKALSKSVNGANSSAIDFGKSTARLSKSKTVTFKDVAGCDEEKEELVEIIDFLKNPRKYNEIGARVPKGVLLFGPPGTGKTLLAKAVAGEAGVPFFSISGSDFVEMFVGVGASRVRDMFNTAKQNAPCIIFIDEIDAVGRQRGAGMGGGHDEREQTLNQLLVEMDGFTGNTGIIVMAATNRPDVLDPALLRPGRFDRQITIANPDIKGREAILKVHARNKHLDPSVKLDDVAQRTPGFSGADLENILNEAALLAARDNRKVINMQDIDEATDRVMMGPAKKSRVISDEEKNVIAHHEAGHAVIGLKLDNANIVQKVTIIARGQAGGYALMLPEKENYLYTKQALLDKITGYLGGRVSEEINFGEITTGASNDFEQATKIARAMVTEYGMSNLGPLQYEKNGGSVFLGRDYLKEKNFSDQVALEIDKEIRRIVEECYELAKKVITENLDLLKIIASYLIKVETLNKSDIEEIESTGKLAWYDKLEEERKQREEAKANEPKEEIEEKDDTNSSLNTNTEDTKPEETNEKESNEDSKPEETKNDETNTESSDSNKEE